MSVSLFVPCQVFFMLETFVNEILFSKTVILFTSEFSLLMLLCTVFLNEIRPTNMR